ncbi:tyrosine-type recombinase/integrase [Rubrivirga sp.]|uniref:tyrosine-type recombinase/integrase n=1 Tax=Rubrivirga sp. TaxID=1885344 RepID=UPI003C7380CB
MTEFRLPIPSLVTVEVVHPRSGPNPATIYLARLAPGSRRTMRGALATVAAICVPDADPAPDPEAFPWEAFRAEHAKAVRAALAERFKYTTANKMLSALRGVLREAWELGLMETEQYHRAAAVRAVKGSSAAAATGRSLARGELRALIEACLTPVSPRKGDAPIVTEKGQRDAALVALGYGCGLRRDELATLMVGDLDLVQRRVVVRGKGNKERVVPIPPGAFHALRDYLAIRVERLVDASDEPTLLSPIYRATPLFVRARRGGQLDRDAESLTGQAVYHVLKKRAKEACVEAFSPHDLRRSYVGDLLDEGADLSVAQQLAGHASPTTTAGYDRRGERAKEQAASRLDIPYDG